MLRLVVGCADDDIRESCVVVADTCDALYKSRSSANTGGVAGPLWRQSATIFLVEDVYYACPSFDMRKVVLAYAPLFQGVSLFGVRGSEERTRILEQPLITLSKKERQVGRWLALVSSGHNTLAMIIMRVTVSTNAILRWTMSLFET